MPKSSRARRRPIAARASKVSLERSNSSIIPVSVISRQSWAAGPRGRAIGLGDHGDETRVGELAGRHVDRHDEAGPRPRRPAPTATAGGKPRRAPTCPER